MKNLIIVLSLLTLIVNTSNGQNDMKSWQRVPLKNGYDDSHILSIDIKGNHILVGTYGRGALFSEYQMKNWTVYDTSNGLSWNFILGGDWDGPYMVLATLGDGINITSDGGVTWKRLGFNFFGIEYLYAVDAQLRDKIAYIPSADGLVVFKDTTEWHPITEKEGLASQYVYDMAMRGDTIALGTLHGYSISYDNGKTWNNFSPNGKFTLGKIPASKVRAVEFTGNIYYAGCDDGLYLSNDRGAIWSRIGQKHLKSDFIHDLVFDKSGRLWIATYKEVASFDPANQKWLVFDERSGLPGGSINCLGVHDDDILAGTNYGLFQLAQGKPYKQPTAAFDAEFLKAEEPVHQWMIRPIPPDEQNCKDQTYLYGSTMGGNFRQHQGNEYNNPEDTPILAVADGRIVFTDSSIGHTVLKCDKGYADYEIYAHYHHQHEILKKVGDHVSMGDTIGMVGKKGNVTNEHLHFEIAHKDIGSQLDSLSQTRNSELWVKPLKGCGTIAGLLVGPDGKPVGGARIYGITKPIPTETPFSFAETYLDKVHPDEAYNENFVIGDVPAGNYVIYTKVDGRSSSVRVHVEASKVTRVRMQLK